MYPNPILMPSMAQARARAPLANMFPGVMHGPARMAPRLRPRRAFTRSFLPGAAVIAGGTPTAQAQATCWGPAWDRACKLCLPMPTPTNPNAQSCSYWRTGG